MHSVVVPTYNRGASISLTLDSLMAQEGTPPFEIVVVDNNSSDETASVVRAYEARTAGRVGYTFEGVQGSSAARNTGIDRAKGKIIAFVDDDVIAEPGWLRHLVGVFEQHPDAWCVGGRVVLKLPDILPRWFNPEPGIMAIYLSRQDYGEGTFQMEGMTGLISANLAIRRVAFRHVGVFDTRLGRFGSRLFCGEDLELVRRIHRAGGGVYYCGLATVAHLVPGSRVSKGFLRQRAYWEGRTEGFFQRRRAPGPRSRTIRAATALMAKDGAKSILLRAAGRERESLEHELAAWKFAGIVRGVLGPTRNGHSALYPKAPP